MATCLVRYADDRLIDQRFPKRPRELNLRCIESLRAMHRPREADSSRNGRNDDAAPDPAGRVSTG
ncbi:hypothetical protein A8E41_18735 [Burkholderia cenocepacia]|nr:hypothetical protein A8E41_18735 [Burkholderia cenocepacia]